MSTFLTLIISYSSFAEEFQTLLNTRNANSDILDSIPKEIPYRHMVTVQEITKEGDEVIEFGGSYRVDPFAEAGRRITFVDKEHSFSEDVLEEIKLLNEEISPTQITEGFWCPSDKDAEFNEILTANDTQVLEENDERVVLLIGAKTMLRTILNDDENDMPRKVRKRMRVKLTLSKPDLAIRKMQMELSRPTKIKVVAKIQEFKIDMDCQMAPNGIPYISETKTSIIGSALGNEFSSRSKMSISQLELSF